MLLHCLLPYRQKFTLVLWHINHGLQDSAAAMEAFARAQADQFNLDIRVDHVHLDKYSGNIEAQARQHRYRIFSAELTEHDALLTGHHANDQAETLLLNMMRGSGPSGLRAIAAQKPLGKGTLLRPLLDVTRDQIKQYAQAHQLQWIDDPSNELHCFDRNYLRHQVIPLLQQRWAATARQLHRVCEWQNESYALLHDLAQIDYQEARCQRPHSQHDCLSLPVLQGLSNARKKNLLRYWLKCHDKVLIGYKKLDQLINQVERRADASPAIEGEGYTIRRYQSALYLVDPLPVVELLESYLLPQQGEVQIDGLGFRQTRADLLQAFGKEDEGQKVELRFRHGENRAVQHGHRLKRLFQAHGVPPWTRSLIPQVVIDEELVGLWLF